MIFAVVKSFIFQLVIKVLVVFTLFKIFTSNYSNDFLVNYIDELFLVVLWGIVLHQFLYFDYFKTKIKNLPPSSFEKLVVDLLLKMGYGGSIKDAGKAIGKSGDEGIDGIIKEDKLGLDVV